LLLVTLILVRATFKYGDVGLQLGQLRRREWLPAEEKSRARPKGHGELRRLGKSLAARGDILALKIGTPGIIP
jgi:hypothetical protein